MKAWALALLAVGSATTASRTGLAQLLVILVLLALWRALRSDGCARAGAGGLGHLCGCSLVVAQFAAAMDRFSCRRLVRPFGDAPGCTSRRVLWSNVLHLIAQKPWLGWGWGSWTMRIT